MALSQNEDKFVGLIQARKVKEARQHVRDCGMKLYSLEMLAAGLAESAKMAYPQGVEECLENHWWENDKKEKVFLQFFDQPYDSELGGKHTSGKSAWEHLLSSGKGQDNAELRACAEILAKNGGFINQRVQISAGQGTGYERPLHLLAARGWIDLARDIEKWSQESFVLDGRLGGIGEEQDKGKTPLALSIISGRGGFAKSLLKDGAEPSKNILMQALHGFVDPYKEMAGNPKEASDAERLLTLRLGVHAAGLAEFESHSLAKHVEDPLASKKNLILWLMQKGARAQAMGLPRQNRLERVAKLHAENASVDWDDMLLAKNAGSAQAQEFGAFSFFAKRKAAKIQETIGKAQPLWIKAAGVVGKRESESVDLTQVLAALSSSDFAKAKKNLSEMEVPAKIQAAVALLGLAKLGFWDMPFPGGVGDDSKNPLYWGGFKLALAYLGEAIDSPVKGLSGLSLMGMCSALGYSDACAALLEAKASPDPDPLLESVSPLSMAVKYQNEELALSLLKAGASPLEKAVPSPFGFSRKEWAIHMAYGQENENLVQAMLVADPRSAGLLDEQGRDLYQRASSDAQKGSTFSSAVAVLAEQANLRVITMDAMIESNRSRCPRSSHSL